MKDSVAPLSLQLGSWHSLGAAATLVRELVFVQEQHVPAEIELDTLDADSLHAVVLDASAAPLATGRLLPDGRIGRMAVLRPWRGHGLGSMVIRALMQAARQQGMEQVTLAAQLHARAFYQKHGFVAQGPVFLDAGIEHVQMHHVFAVAGPEVA